MKIDQAFLAHVNREIDRIERSLSLGQKFDEDAQARYDALKRQRRRLDMTAMG